MTDDKKPTEEFGDINWDEALSEWEHTSFDPEVAKDSATAKPGALAGASRPLYRPPTVSPAVKPRPAVPPVARMWSPGEEEEGTAATRIAHVPDELLQDSEGERKPSHGGLGASLHVPPARALLPTLPADEETGAAPSDDIHQPFDLTTGGDAAPRAKGPALLVPMAREYDPNEVTVVGSEADLANRRSAILEELSEPPPESASEGTSTVRPSIDREPRVPPRAWANERPASEWLSEATREAFEARGSWLEREAQALGDKAARARGLLACSEIFAVAGDRERAQALAAEARDVDPSLALAHRQARALMPFSLSACEDYVEALDAEVNLSPQGPSRLHSMLLAADALRAAGQDEAAGQRLEDAALRLPESPELAPIAEAIATCLRLRWVDHDSASADARRGDRGDTQGASAGERSPTEVLLRARQAIDKGDVAEAAPLVAELAVLPELASAAKWLAASLGATTARRRADAARWLRGLAEQGDEEARRALVARCLELGDSAQLTGALATDGQLTSAERVTIAALAGLPLSATDPHLDATASTPGMQALAAAITALAMPSESDREAQVQARAQRTSGSPNTRARVRLARLLAASGPLIDIEAALEALGIDRAPPGAARSGPERAPTGTGSVPPGEGHPAEVRAIALEMAARAGRISDVSSALEAWGG
ncbi:MAG TPA: hypothetical protein VN894_14210, partial [Polyangiaceae bacterium]|nr:hypothetical protein [Polyangiaceae bacterium]